MAERRMFAKTIVDSDAFLDMPLTTQSLYFHLSMRADDDGFINNPKKIQRMIGCSDDDLKLLTAKKFILIFESGVIVIKHWKIHNYIRKDRYNETLYQEEKKQLGEKENKGYSFLEACHSNVNEVGLPDDTQRLPQVRLGKVRLGKVKLIKDIAPLEETPKTLPSTKKVSEADSLSKHKHGEFKNVLLTDVELDKLKESYADWQKKIDNLSIYIGSTGKSYKSHYLTILSWARRDKTNKSTKNADTPQDYSVPDNFKNKPGKAGNGLDVNDFI